MLIGFCCELSYDRISSSAEPPQTPRLSAKIGGLSYAESGKATGKARVGDRRLGIRRGR
jgi:hypothetical protein